MKRDAFIIVSDDSLHRYLIPEREDLHWYAWIGSEDWKAGEVPTYAVAINGPLTKVKIYAYSLGDSPWITQAGEQK